VKLVPLDDLEEMVSYGRSVTGIGNTIFLSPKGIKVAIVPPDSVDPRNKVASIAFDGSVVAGEINPELLSQVRQFLALNRQVLADHWRYRIDTEELQRRLRPVPQ